MKPSKQEIRSRIENGEQVRIELDDERLLHDLAELVRIFLRKTHVFKNTGIENKQEQKERYLQKISDGENFKPDFQFREYPYSRGNLVKTIDHCIDKTAKIDNQNLEKYGAEQLEPGEMREFFAEIFRELKLHLKLAEGIENEDDWRKYSRKIWALPDEEVVQESYEKLGAMEPGDPEKNLDPEEVAEMFREEVRRLEMEYSVETRKVSGCHNIPEEKTLVVARGENGERTYSREEARMLTMHEIFHAVRAYNGFKAGEKSGFPDIIGLHTPFYDRAEEGGALYREKMTGTMYPRKEFDYHLRLVAAYEISEADSFRQDFSEIAEKLIDLGATKERAFELLARNREALRHHIYLAGLHDWREIENKEKMLVGKVNEEWAEKFWKEAEKGGMIQKPEIGSEKLFDFTFKD